MKKFLALFSLATVLSVNLFCINEVETKFLEAVKSGSVEAVKVFIDSGIDVNVKNGSGRTSVHLASMLGLDDVIELLVAHGADVNALDNNSATPLHLALKWFGMDKVVKKLLVSGAKPNIKDRGGVTPLFQAIMSNNEKIVNMLIEYGAKGLNSSLSFAIRTRNLKMIEMCVKCGADINRRNKHGKNVLHKAILSGDVSVVDLILRYGASVNDVDGDGISPLRIAVRKGFCDIVDFLIKRCASLVDDDNLGNSLLHDAVWYSRDDFEKEKYRMTVEILLRNNVYANVRDKRDRTPLHIAAICGSKEITKTLLEYGADKNVFDSSGNKPITYAQEYKTFGVYADVDCYNAVIKELE
jgi:uncharacterized protein